MELRVAVHETALADDFLERGSACVLPVERDRRRSPAGSRSDRDE
jgi:hypothetical protein